MYLDSLCSQTIFGLTDKFKFSPTANATRGRRKSHVLHLSTVKPVIVTKENVIFDAIYSGMRVDVGEFNFISRDGYLQVTNI